jgi:undecaprenyl-phosphate galactose phosphotransferase/putative colanic acid biosynthesis UDP-glucose lipid carrier transferase
MWSSHSALRDDARPDLPPPSDEAARHGGLDAQRKEFRFPLASIQYCSALSDAVLIVLASLGGGIGYQLAINGYPGNINAFLGTGLIASLLYVLIAQSVDFYRLSAIISPRTDLRQVLALWSLVGLLLALLAFLMKASAAFSRGSFLCFFLLALALLSAARLGMKAVIKEAVTDGRIRGRRVVIVGSQEELSAIDSRRLLRGFGLSEVGRVGLFNDRRGGLSIAGVDARALDLAQELAREHDADEIVLALPWNDTRKLELIRDRLRSSPLPVRLLPDRHIQSLTQNPAYRVGKTLSAEIQRAPLQWHEQMMKRLLDIVGASIALIVLMPIMVMAAIAIKLDSPGPVFFRQRRIGFNAKQFLIFKFRTMTVMEDGAEVRHARRFDSRVTRVGRILRQTSIDELPQLLNVLIGNMSLIGPRPHALAHDGYYGDLLSHYAFRRHVKPGITGWAQVNGYRGEITRVEQMKGRVDRDLWYINNWSLKLDLKIALLTCFEVLRRRNAY